MALIKLHVIEDSLHHVWEPIVHVLSLLVLRRPVQSMCSTATWLDNNLFLLFNRVLPRHIKDTVLAHFHRSAFEIKFEPG